MGSPFSRCFPGGAAFLREPVDRGGAGEPKPVKTGRKAAQVRPGAADIRRPGQWNSYRTSAETLAAAFPPLLVRAEQVAASVAQGIHGRRRVGSGETFWEFRRYREGDPLARIDWRQSAKTAHVYVRENEWEAAQSIWLWRDGSPSMHFQSNQSAVAKFERASVVTLALASLLIRAGERIAALGDGHNPANGRVTLRRLALEFAEGTLQAENRAPLMPLPASSQLILISDFLCTPEELEEWTRVIDFYGNRRVTGHVLQVLDPVEIDFPFKGRSEFLDLEERLDLVVGRSESLAEAYQRKISAITETLRSTCSRRGWTFARHRTDKPPQTALLSLFAGLTEAGHSVDRLNTAGSVSTDLHENINETF